MPSERSVLETGEVIGEGDSFLVDDFLPSELSEHAFGRVRDEVQWHRMVHRGGEVPRLVAVQGSVSEDGSCPIYRHPADESPPLLPFSPTVELIRQHVEQTLRHPVNHVLIQHYRTGADYISEHSDKTSTSSAVQDRQPHPAPHNSMFVLGLETNMRWLHGIRTDKRPEKTKSAEERFANGERISLTFRHIGTFLSPGETHIYGQGARGRRAQALIDAFGKENHSSEFDWDAAYGAGSDVFHFSERTDAL
ncbi:uncharacterized protein B0H18DRAFT_1082257 [Fomitopsis serialis]|uniref:uncharacterized protein n=1 Tax=Fomitopsis serialis TaxID=139415 RepID=UPI0020084785|nr:uncharacterized protein B0H18DRAFT_1082257 [Neoantrodia serialis]KAH9935509.1 hypothetical protein B0H18DRAFT_1082257 [Neoantrodia serialis]